MLDQDNAAARRFYELVRRFCAQAKPITQGIQFVDVMPQECWDITKLSLRVYGSREEALACAAALGIDQLNLPTTQQRVAMPTAVKLLQLKREAGIETVADLRMSGKPIWKRD